MEYKFVVLGVIEFEEDLVDEGTEMGSSLNEIEGSQVGYFRYFRESFEQVHAVSVSWASEVWREEVLVFEDEERAESRESVIEDIEDPLTDLVSSS